MKSKDDFIKLVDKRFFNHLNKNSLIPFNIDQPRKEFLSSVYDTLLSQVTSYKPKKPRKFISSPKNRFVIRMIPTFELADYCIYYYLIKSFEDYIAENRTEGTFGGFRLGGTLRRKENEEFEPDFEDSFNENSFNLLAWKNEYGEYQAALRKSASKMGTDYLYAIHFDIANFYDCIRLDLLRKKLIKKISDNSLKDEMHLLFQFLKFWNKDFDSEKIVGIPQEELGDCSRILSNFFLQDYDKYVFDKCEERSAKYIRYADDQIIFAKSKEDAEELVFLASQKLFKEGLNINNKSKVFTNYQEFDDIYGFSIFEELRLNSVNINKAFELFEIKINLNSNFRASSVLKRLLHQKINHDELSSKNRIKLLSFLWDDNFLLFANNHYMGQIYKMLKTDREKDEFIENLNEINAITKFESYKIHLEKFKKSLNL